MEHDHLETLLGVFAKHHRPPLSLRTLAQRAGVAEAVLSPGYSRQRSAGTVLSVVQGAQDILTEVGMLPKTASLFGWMRTGDPVVEAIIGEALTSAWCPACPAPGLVKPDEFWVALGRCKNCQRARSTKPATNEWLAQVDELIGQARPELHAAWRQVRADESAAVTYQRLADAAGMDVEQLKALWVADELPLRPAGRPRKPATETAAAASGSRRRSTWARPARTS